MPLVDPELLNADALLRAAVILCVGLLLLFSSLTTIAILCSNPALDDVTGCYLKSLASADLLCALLITPFSVYSSLAPLWRFMGDDSLVCKFTSYLQVVLLSATIYTYAWIGVDRYAAFMKPSRYDVEHTMTRCKCWILFSWITAMLLSCPMLMAKAEVNYYPELELCVLNWQSTMAYSITLAVLVLLPSICTIAFTSAAIYGAIRRPEELEDSQRSAIETDHNFIIALFILVSFALAWTPIVVLQFLPKELIHPADLAIMRFTFVWLAIGSPSAKLLIYLFANSEFRESFLFAATCCACFRRGRKRTGLGDGRRPLSKDERSAEERGTSNFLIDKLCCFPNSTPLPAAITALASRARLGSRGAANSIEAANRVIEQHFQRAQQQISSNATLPVMNAVRYQNDATNAVGRVHPRPATRMAAAAPYQLVNSANSTATALYGSFDARHQRELGESLHSRPRPYYK